MNNVTLKISQRRKRELLVDCVTEHLTKNKGHQDIPIKITHDYIIGILIDYYLERR